MNWIEILIGLGLLTFGRRFFWVFVGGAGFAAGLWLMQTFFPDQPQYTMVIAGAVGAVAGIALTKFVKSVAVNVGGFLGGGVIGLGLARMLAPGMPEWLAFIVVGILGVVLMRKAFDTALLLISSIAGAVLIAQNLSVSEPLRAVVLVGLALGGVLIQRKVKRDAAPSKE